MNTNRPTPWPTRRASIRFTPSDPRAIRAANRARRTRCLVQSAVLGLLMLAFAVLGAVALLGGPTR